VTEQTSSLSQAGLIEGAAGVAPSPGGGIRDLLRDTALFVSKLDANDFATGYETIRVECNAMIDKFGAALVRRGYMGDVLDDATLAQCALLDEIALKGLIGADRDMWASQPLQVTKFNQHDAGERVFDRLDVRLRERVPRVDLLQCYATILGLGFKGRYAVNGDAARDMLIADLNARLEKVRAADPRTLLVDQSGQRFGDVIRRLSPWTIAVVAGVVSFVLWLLWHVALDAQLTGLASKAIKP
jgi:type VI secretion system protein ImpK